MTRITSTSTMPAKESFGEQAARFSMYAPIAAFVIGCLGRGGGPGDRPEQKVALILFGINMFLIVAGFILGIIALISIKRFGPERILGRAIVGVLLNGAMLFLIAWVFMPMLNAGSVKQQVTGQWRMTNAPDPTIKQLDLTLNKDGTYTLNTTRTDGESVNITGTWVYTPAKLIGVTIRKINGADNELTGKKVGLGTVTKVDDKQLVLRTDKGEETYQRLP